MSTSANPPTSAASAEDWPAAVKRHPRPAQWLRVDEEGRLEVRSGKVEIGQGIQRALARLVARELGWPLARVRVSHPSTATHPDEGMTSGSLSMQDSGAALRTMAAVLRERLCEAAARRWDVPREQVELREARLVSSQGLSIDAATLLEPALLETPVQGVPPPAASWVPDLHPDALHPSLTRRAVFRGEPHFIHDLHLPGLLHGRVLHPPALDDRPLAGTWPDGLAPLPGQVDAWRDGALFGVLAERPSQAQALLERVASAVRWQPAEPGSGAPGSGVHGLDPHRWPDLPLEPRLVSQRGAELPDPGTTCLRATYLKPWLAHASIGPSCALARWRDGAEPPGPASPAVPKLEVWTHSQGLFPLRRDLALAFGLQETEVVVHHRPGAGCYGHNGADDAAFDAAWLARRVPGRPVRVLWSREDDLARAPLGPAMLVQMEARLDEAGRIVAWSHALWSPGHSSRPGRAAVPALLGHAQREGGTPLPPAIDMPMTVGGGSDRNAIPGYDLPAWRVTAHLVRAPWRSSALRSLGALGNVFAAESFIDEIAQATGRDPLAWRESLLGHDPRGLAVLRAAAAAEAGLGHGEPDEGGASGHGLAYARYKGTGAWCAVLAQVEVAAALRVRRLVVVADVGRVVDAPGAVQQLEGGAIQATSWALKEAVQPGEDGRTPASGPGAVPMLGFSEVPEVQVVLMPSDGAPLGAGEASVGPTVAAIANALARALGVRVRELPLTPARIRAAIEAQA